MLQVIAYLDTGQQRRRTLNSMHVKLGIYPAASCFESKPFFSTQLQCLVLPSLQCCCIQHCSIGHPSSDSVSAVALSVRSTQHPDHTAWHLSMSDRTPTSLSWLSGSGKTLVSVLLIKDKAGSLNENGHKRVTIFLAPKVLLVQQVCLHVTIFIDC